MQGATGNFCGRWDRMAYESVRRLPSISSCVLSFGTRTIFFANCSNFRKGELPPFSFVGVFWISFVVFIPALLTLASYWLQSTAGR